MESYSSAELGLADFPDVQISIKVPKRTTSGDSWTGFYRSAGGGGISEMSPTKTDLHLAGREFDMDAATGYKRSPGTAGAHPVIKGEGEHSASFLRHTQHCDMGRAASCPQTARFY